MSARLPFDRISITGDDNEPLVDMSLDAFQRLPLQRRVRMLLQDRVQFFLGDEVVDTRVALNSLRLSGLASPVGKKATRPDEGKETA